MIKRLGIIMKKLMIIGAGPLQMPAITQAKKMGLYVVAVDMDENAIGFKYSDECLVISTIDIPNVVKAAKRIKVDGVITLCTDYPMRTVAAVAESLGLPAISVEDAFRATDKISMRETLKEKGVPVPFFRRVKNSEDFLNAVNEVLNLGYRCIVKPADSSGSRGVMLLDKFEKNELLNAYEYSKNCSHSGEVVVEEYMEGDEVCVETLSIDGKCYPIQITDKLTTGAPYFVEMGHSQPSQHSVELQNEIKRVAVACNLALGNYNGSSCTELKLTKDGVKVVEMGARLAGDYMTTDLVPLSTGVNMVESVIKIALGEKPDISPKYEKASAIRFFETDNGIIESVDGLEKAREIPGVIRAVMDKKVGEKVTVIRNSLDRAGYVIAQADTPENAVKICEEAMSLIKIKVV